MSRVTSSRGTGVRLPATVVGALLAAALSLGGCAQGGPPGERGPAELLVAPAPPPVGPPPELEPALTLASRLSHENPDDFGIPAIRHGEVVLPVTSELARPIADASTPPARTAALLAYDRWRREHLPARPSPPDLLEKRLRLTEDGLRAFAEDVEPVHGERSLDETHELTDQVLDLATQDRFADARAMNAGYEAELDKVVLSLETLTPALAAALVERFGTRDVAVREEPYHESGY